MEKWTWKIPPAFWKGMAIGAIGTVVVVFVRAAIKSPK